MEIFEILINNRTLWEWYFIVALAISLIIWVFWFWRTYKLRKDLKCELCDETFKNRTALTEHMRLAHEVSIENFSEKCQNFLWNAIIQYFGFFLVPVQLQILIIIFKTDNGFGKISVLAVLYILLIFISIFCLSGRGIQITQWLVLVKGIKKISIGWPLITIEWFGEKTSEKTSVESSKSGS
jgi:hypothetical protein